MIASIHRFHGRGSIQRLYANGSTVRSGSLMLKYAPNPKRRDYRVAVVVSKKVSKSAVVRNRIRRRVYENVRILSSVFTGAYDLIFTVYDEKIATMPSDELQAEVVKIAHKAHVVSAADPHLSSSRHPER